MTRSLSGDLRGRVIAAIVRLARLRLASRANRARDAKFRSTTAVAALHENARAVFTDLAKTDEGGELFLFLLAERFLRIPGG